VDKDFLEEMFKQHKIARDEGKGGLQVIDLLKLPKQLKQIESEQEKEKVNSVYDDDAELVNINVDSTPYNRVPLQSTNDQNDPVSKSPEQKKFKKRNCTSPLIISDDDGQSQE